MAHTAEPFDIRVIEHEAPTQLPKRTRMKSIAAFSAGRFFKIMLAWLGIPAALVAGYLLPPGGPAEDFIKAWSYLGVATLMLNAAGIVTLRRRRSVPDDAD